MEQANRRLQGVRKVPYAFRFHIDFPMAPKSLGHRLFGDVGAGSAVRSSNDIVDGSQRFGRIASIRFYTITKTSYIECTPISQASN